MPRATQSKEAGILGFFKTADLAIAVLLLKLASDEVKARTSKSSEARERALATQKKAARAALKPAATPAAAPAKPKASHKKGAGKKGAPKAPATSSAAEETFDLPGTGANS